MYVSETVQIDSLRGLLDISLIVHLALTVVCVDVCNRHTLRHRLTAVLSHVYVCMLVRRYRLTHYEDC